MSHIHPLRHPSQFKNVQMILSIIVAMDEHGIIGRNNGLPWRLSADLKYVKQTTMGKPIIMGRKTHESIGKALPGRENIVISRDTNYISDGCHISNSLEEALIHCENVEEAFILGGAELYRLALDKTSRLYLTEVHTKVDGDTLFPQFNRGEWQECSRESFAADEKNEYPFSFVVLERTKSP